MVRWIYPARHLSDRSLVQNWDASRADSLGLDQRPKGSLKPRHSMHGFDTTPVQILQWFRSLAGSHFEETRAHLGLNLNANGHRKRSRTTLTLLALFSIVTVVAHQQQKQHPFELPAAWYRRRYRRLPMP